MCAPIVQRFLPKPCIKYRKAFGIHRLPRDFSPQRGEFCFSVFHSFNYVRKCHFLTFGCLFSLLLKKYELTVSLSLRASLLLLPWFPKCHILAISPPISCGFPCNVSVTLSGTCVALEHSKTRWIWFLFANACCLLGFCSMPQQGFLHMQLLLDSSSELYCLKWGMGQLEVAQVSLGSVLLSAGILLMMPVPAPHTATAQPLFG